MEAREAGAAPRVGSVEDPLGDARRRGRGRGGAVARWPPSRLAPRSCGGGAEVCADGRVRRRSRSSLPASVCGGAMAPHGLGGGMALGPAAAQGGREIREGGRKGADGRRQKYTRRFLQIFATVATRGMPRRLRTLVWRIWDLRRNT